MAAGTAAITPSNSAWRPQGALGEAARKIRVHWLRRSRSRSRAAPADTKASTAPAWLRPLDRAPAPHQGAAHGPPGHLPVYDWLKGCERPGGPREAEPARRASG